MTLEVRPVIVQGAKVSHRIKLFGKRRLSVFAGQTTRATLSPPPRNSLKTRAQRKIVF